jgi:hypothetical protein
LPEIDGRLASYALAAGAALAGAPAANASIIYESNPTPSVSINSSLGPLSADFFLANGVNQFRITIKTFLTSSEPFSFARLTVRPLSSGAISAISSAFSSLYANALNSGDSIGCGCGFVPFKIPMVSVGSLSLPSSAGSFGPWANATGKFLGLGFIDASSNPHLGWARFNVTTTASFGNVFISAELVDYAYEDEAFAPIRAGQTVADAPEPGTLGMLALGAVGLGLWRKRRKPAAE